MNWAEASSEIPSEEKEARQSSRSVTSWPFLLPSDWTQTDRCHRESPEDTNLTNTHIQTVSTIPSKNNDDNRREGNEKNINGDWKVDVKDTPAWGCLSPLFVLCMPVLLRSKCSLKNRKISFTLLYLAFETWLLLKLHPP